MGHGAEVGEKAKGVKSENIEGRRGDEGSLEVFWRRTAGADFLCECCALSPGTIRFNKRANLEE